MNSYTGRRRWVAGALRAGRAAAFLTLATGINGTVAALEPRYEPIYVYLVAVVIVAWLGTVLLGITTAVVAVVVYDAMFGPAGGGLSASSVVPFAVAIAAAILARAARAPLQKPAFPTATERPLLDVPTVVSVTPSVDTREMEALRAQLADAGRVADESRRAAENEARLRVESSANARARLAGLQHELDAARRDALEQAKRAAALQAQLDESGQRGGETAARASTLERELNETRARLGELQARTQETAQELEVAWRRVDEEKGRADAERSRVNDLERRANDALQRVTADIAAKYQQPLTEAKKHLGEAIARIAAVEKERDEARKQLAEAEERFERERNVRDDAEAVAREKMRLALEEGERRHAAARAELTASFDARLSSVVAGITSDYEESLGQATVDREAARAEVRSLTKRLEVLQKRVAEKDEALARSSTEIEELRAAVERLQRQTDDIRGLTEAEYASLTQAAETRAAALERAMERMREDLESAQTARELERAERERVERERDGKIASIVNGLTSDYETSLGEALVEKEAARAEVRELTSKVTELERKLEEQRAATARAREDALKDRNDRLSDYASKVMQAELSASALSQEVERLKKELEDTRSLLEIERSERKRTAGEFDRKIASIVAGITGDHEQALGEAVVEKEAAKAEARSLSNRLEALQRKLSQFDSLQAQVERSTAELRSEVEAERARANEEKAKREKLEQEWSDKLNTIVSHLATDHEADLGQALLEREEARAEARDLANKLKSVQKKLEEERLRGRPQERPTMTGGSARPATILVVHSDAGTRAMTKHALELSGYVVVTAADGLEGLRTAAVQRPDVVVAESVMPKMNGRELLQLLKARPETAGVKVILISAGSREQDRSSDFRADDVLETPSDFAAMRATLANVLAKS